MRALPIAITGIVGLILAEVLKLLAPILTTWLLAALLFGAKIGLAALALLAFGLVATVAVLTVMVVRQRRRTDG